MTMEADCSQKVSSFALKEQPKIISSMNKMEYLLLLSRNREQNDVLTTKSVSVSFDVPDSLSFLNQRSFKTPKTKSGFLSHLQISCRAVH